MHCERDLSGAAHGRPAVGLITLMTAAALLAGLACVPAVGAASATSVPYRMPPPKVMELIDAPPTPLVSFGPNNEWMLIAEYPLHIPIAELAQPELRLAGNRINPRTNGPSREWYFTALSLRRITGDTEREITGLPQPAHITRIRWSPDGTRVAFVCTQDDGLTLWTAAVADGRARRVSDVKLNGALTAPYEWLADSRTLVALTVPADRGDPPQEPLVPEGPVVQENLGRKAPARTYQDLLQNAHDEALYEHYGTAQVRRIALDGRAVALGKPAMIRRAAPSPDGRYLLVETLHRPYSYSLPEYRFPYRVEVWDLDGRIVAQIADRPLADQVPIAYGSVPDGPRSFGWRADSDATLCWAEALDGGDGGSEAGERDQLYLLPAPFQGEPQPWVTLALRYGGVTWGRGDLAIVSDWWWKTRRMRALRAYPDQPERAPQVLIDRSWEDRYNDPGTPLTRRNARGADVLLTADNGQTLFLEGEGASPEGDRPFLDAYDLETLESTRLFRSAEPHFERPERLLDVERRLLVTRREGVTEQPNFFLRDLRADTIEPLTRFPHPTPQFTDIRKELIHYEREDGVPLTGTLYLPPGFTPGEDPPPPMLMWAYPEEYKSADAAGQVKDSPYRFVRLRWYSPMIWLALGFAVLDDPSLPIIGEGDVEPNDTFVEQLVMGAEAAVAEVVRRGVADPERIAVGGHSYGAFMTANLLAHSDLFRLGLARTGAYNRTLTPFGFQAEERTLWEAPDAYFTLSPFMHAEKIDEPILLTHGSADSNPGTFPLQSERFYEALKGLGATVRLVMLPHESHSYRARESVMHVMAESADWLERYVAEAEPRGAQSAAE